MIRKKFRDKLAELGINVAEFETLRPSMIDPERQVRDRVGYEFVHRTQGLIGVIDMEPRGWGGDGKWYLRRTRGGAVEGKYNTQREALAGFIRHAYGL